VTPTLTLISPYLGTFATVLLILALSQCAVAAPFRDLTSACGVIEPDLPSNCNCTDKHLGFVAECDVSLGKFLDDTIGVKFDVEPCGTPAEMSLDITEKDHHIDFPIAGITAGKEENIPIPGLSIAVPKIGNLGVDAAVLISGNPDELTLKVGLNACVAVGSKDICASSIPLLNEFLPLYLLSGTYSFGHVCNSTALGLRGNACNPYDTITSCEAQPQCAWSHFGCVKKE